MDWGLLFVEYYGVVWSDGTWRHLVTLWGQSLEARGHERHEAHSTLGSTCGLSGGKADDGAHGSREVRADWVTDLSSVRAFLMSLTSVSLATESAFKSVRYPFGSITVCPETESMMRSSFT